MVLGGDLALIGVVSEVDVPNSLQQTMRNLYFQKRTCSLCELSWTDFFEPNSARSFPAVVEPKMGSEIQEKVGLTFGPHIEDLFGGVLEPI